jgi:hypothetical protein
MSYHSTKIEVDENRIVFKYFKMSPYGSATSQKTHREELSGHDPAEYLGPLSPPCRCNGSEACATNPFAL